MATILIIEDGAINRRFLASMLRGYGQHVLEAADGAEALKLVHRVDLLLIDILASNLDAYQFIMKLRAEPGLLQPRVIFRAAPCIEAETRILADACGAFFVSKSDDTNGLISAIDTVLAQPRPSAEGLEPGSEFVGGVLLQIARKLHAYAMKLESLNSRLDRGVIQRDAQLDVTRSALDQEIKKRIWAEQELTQANYGLRDLVVRDALTGLYNRRYLDESLGREESRALRSGRPLAFVMLDIDYFKRINDTFGHAAGDAVLREVGGYLLSVARREDIICRYGGEEFVLLMSQTSQEKIGERAEKIRRGIHALKVEHDGVPVGPVSVSIGVGIFPDHGDSGQDVLKIADEALYLAKQSGRNRVELGERVKAWKTEILLKRQQFMEHGVQKGKQSSG